MKAKRGKPSTEPCPTPTKALYRSAAEADAATLTAERTNRRIPLKAYRCRCGFWHLASDWESD